MTTETSTNQELLKTRYVDPVNNAVPKNNVLQTKIKFDANSKTGKDYTGAVLLNRPQGFTFAGGAARNTAFALNPSRAGTTKQITVVPFETVLQEDIAYGFAASMQSSEAAFDPELALIFESMVDSHNQMYELNMAYGGTYLGIANANTGSTPNAILQISKAEWSPMIWGPLENALLDFYSDSALTTKVTLGGPAVLTAVDIDNRKLYVTFANGTDYTAAVAALPTLYATLYGAVGNIGLGVQPLIVQSAAGGTVFGVNTSNYAYMRATSFATTGALTFTKVANAVINPATKGGMGELDVLLNAYSWTDVMNDQAALRQYVGDYGGEFENGADELIYYGANGGMLRFQCDPMIKATEALVLSFEDWRSVGATLPTFDLPGSSPSNPKFYTELQDNAGFRVRRYSQTGTYCRRLARQCLITGIVNNSGPSGGGS